MRENGQSDLKTQELSDQGIVTEKSDYSKWRQTVQSLMPATPADKLNEAPILKLDTAEGKNE